MSLDKFGRHSGAIINRKQFSFPYYICGTAAASAADTQDFSEAIAKFQEFQQLNIIGGSLNENDVTKDYVDSHLKANFDILDKKIAEKFTAKDNKDSRLCEDILAKMEDKIVQKLIPKITALEGKTKDSRRRIRELEDEVFLKLKSNLEKPSIFQEADMLNKK